MHGTADVSVPNFLIEYETESIVTGCIFSGYYKAVELGF